MGCYAIDLATVLLREVRTSIRREVLLADRGNKTAGFAFCGLSAADQTEANTGVAFGDERLKCSDEQLVYRIAQAMEAHQDAVIRLAEVPGLESFLCCRRIRKTSPCMIRNSGTTTEGMKYRVRNWPGKSPLRLAW
jgi:hypothetical protein